MRAAHQRQRDARGSAASGPAPSIVAGLLQLGRDRLQAGQQDDHGEAGDLPHDHGDDRPEGRLSKVASRLTFFSVRPSARRQPG